METLQLNANDIMETPQEHRSIRALMTPAPISVSPSIPVDEARALMQRHRIRHLPVLENGRLVGIVSDRDIRLVLPSPATSLSVYEIGYLLARLTVGEIMTYFPVTIGADRLVAEAIKRMLARAKVSPKPWEWTYVHEMGCCFPVGEHLTVQVLPDQRLASRSVANPRASP